MFTQNTLIAGLIALLVGFALGNVTARDGDEQAERLDALSEKLDGIETGNGAVSEAVASLGSRFDGLEERLNGLEGGLGEGFGALEAAVSSQADVVTSGNDDLRQDFAALSESMEGAFAEANSATGETIAAAVASLQEAMPASVAEVAPAAAAATAAVAAATTAVADTATEAAAEAVTDAADSAVEEVAETAEPAAESMKPGQTAVLADGAIKAFVSRIDETAGRAVVAINGLDLVSLGDGFTTGIMGSGGEACALTTSGMSDGEAVMSAVCDDARGEPMGIAPGLTVTVADGVRVFFSGGNEDFSGGRFAVNGQKVSNTGIGEPVVVPGADCSVFLEGIDRNRAVFSSDC